jgi:hypothetical protein
MSKLSQGMKHPEPRMQRLDGFNEAWIEFEHGESKRRKGSIGLKEVLTKSVQGVSEIGNGPSRTGAHRYQKIPEASGTASSPELFPIKPQRGIDIAYRLGR